MTMNLKLTLFASILYLVINFPSIHCENPYLQWMSFYGFNPDVQHGWSYGICCEFWANGTQGESNNITEVLNDISSAYTKYNMTSMYGPLPDCGGCGDGIFDRSGGALDPNWSSNLQNLLKIAQPYVTKGIITGFFLGDELCCAGLPLSNLTSVADMIRSTVNDDGYGISGSDDSGDSGDIIIYTNECDGTVNGWPSVPESIDWISFDLYDVNNGTHGAHEIISSYETYIFPRLNDNQKVVLVPGIMGCNYTQSELDINSVQIVNDLDILFEWAKNETNVAGFNPWHFNNRSTNQAAPPCNMKPGGVMMPDVVNKLKEIGTYIMKNSKN